MRFTTVLVVAALAGIGCGSKKTAVQTSAAQPPGGTPTPTSPAAPAAQQGENPIVVENRLAGSDAWQLRHRSPPGVFEAYAGATSVQHGEPIELHVRADGGHTLRWQVWRMGWYGGAQGRLLSSGGPVPVTNQATPSPTSTGLVECRWPVTFTVETDASWPSGVYLVKLVRDDGFDAHVPFVVRADERKGAAVFQASFTTYQAYNAWGGYSLYDGGPAAVEVSFDRPYLQGTGSGQYLRYEHDFVTWAESRGFDLTYLTNVDVDRDPSLLLGQKLFLSVGHDEYWSRGEREAVEAALAQGTSLAFFSANTCYWQIRLEASHTDGRPGRTQVCWKKRADAEDPMRGTPLETARWRDPPVNQPESALLGVMFTAWEKSDFAWVVTSSSAWPYEGTGAHDGDQIPGIVGYETDRTTSDTPAGTVVIARSPVRDVDGHEDVQEATVRELPNGAFVFAAGTIQWSWGLSRDGVRDARVQRITENVFRRAGLVPANPPASSGGTAGTGNGSGGTPGP